MVGQAGAGSSRTDQPKARLAAASEDWGHSPCRRQPASTQTRHQRQPHSEEYCEREVEWQDGRAYLHLGARRDDPPRRWRLLAATLPLVPCRACSRLRHPAARNH